MSEPVCRTCLSRTDSNYRFLFKESFICSEKRSFANLLAEFIPSLEISKEDNFPQTICSKCALDLKHCFRFRNKCLQADTVLRSSKETNFVGGNLPANLEEEESTDSADSESGPSEIVLPKEVEPPNKQNDHEMETPTEFKPEVQVIPHRPKSLECPFCQKVLGSAKSYRTHLALHSHESNFLCNHCGERFKTKMSYAGHMATHNPNKYWCELCDKSYRQAASLRSHVLHHHSQERPFKCSICNHATTQKSSLSRHMLTHSEQKSYVCDLCGEHFRFKGNLAVHKQRHKKQKDFSCEKCSKSFVTKDELANHAMSHTEEKPFECNLCSKAFTRKSTLQFHRKHTHSIQPKNACHVCGRGFAQKISLQNHLKTHILTD